MNIDDIKKKMGELSDNMKTLQTKMTENGKETKKEVEAKLADAKSELENTKEQYRILSERGKSKMSSELIRAQMNFNVAKEEIQKKKEALKKEYQNKKDEYDKDKLDKQINDDLEYAQEAAEFAIMASEEAVIAYLEAIDLQLEYDEKYGKNK